MRNFIKKFKKYASGSQWGTLTQIEKHCVVIVSFGEIIRCMHIIKKQILFIVCILVLKRIFYLFYLYHFLSLAHVEPLTISSFTSGPFDIWPLGLMGFMIFHNSPYSFTSDDIISMKLPFRTNPHLMVAPFVSKRVRMLLISDLQTVCP